MVEIQKNGKVVKRSKNLRGILDYARISPVLRAYIGQQRDDKQWPVLFVFLNGAKAKTLWGSKTICIDWLKRRRSWGEPTQGNVGKMLFFSWAHVARAF